MSEMGAAYQAGVTACMPYTNAENPDYSETTYAQNPTSTSYERSLPSPDHFVALLSTTIDRAPGSFNRQIS